MDHMQSRSQMLWELIQLPMSRYDLAVAISYLKQGLSIPSTQTESPVRLDWSTLKEVNIGASGIVVPLEQSNSTCIWKCVAEVKTIAESHMIDNPVRFPTLLLQLLASTKYGLSMKNARFKSTQIWMQNFSSTLTMRFIFFELDASIGTSVPLTVLGLKNNFVVLLCQGRSKTSKLSGKIIV